MTLTLTLTLTLTHVLISSSVSGLPQETELGRRLVEEAAVRTGLSSNIIALDATAILYPERGLSVKTTPLKQRIWPRGIPPASLFLAEPFYALCDGLPPWALLRYVGRATFYGYCLLLVVLGALLGVLIFLALLL